MAPSKQAQKNHDQLFPDHVSTLAVTDPKLIETVDNFAFDEALRESKLSLRTRLMVQLAAIIACAGVREYRVMYGAALGVGVTPVEAKEIVYQSGALLGHGEGIRFPPRHERSAGRMRHRTPAAGPVHDKAGNAGGKRS